MQKLYENDTERMVKKDMIPSFKTIPAGTQFVYVPAVFKHRGRFSVLTKNEKNDSIIRVMHSASCSKNKKQ